MDLSQCNRAQGTIKQRAFVRYLFDVNNPLTFGNGTQSARKARYKGSDGVLANVAWQNVRKPQVIKMAEEITQTILSTDEIEKEISRVAKQLTPIDGAMKMKALDLLTKIKGMVTQKIESTDTSERDGIASGLISSINQAAKRDNLSPKDAAIQLFSALRDMPGMNDPVNWGEFQSDIEVHLVEQQRVNDAPTEIGDQ